jgi:hypothetical protein
MKLQAIRHDTQCRICKGDKITTVLNLKPTPPEDQFISKDHLNTPQESYTLDLALCEDCGYLHLPHILNPEISYPDYIYVTKVTLGLENHYQSYADEILSMVQLSGDALAIDLGSNDGTMLQAFKNRDLKVLGVEPGRLIAKAANEEGIPTINDFFSGKVTENIVSEHGKASIVTANYMYANIDDLLDFTENVAKVLAEDGVFVVQTGYHPEQMKIKMFDYIYHEHFSYFTVSVLQSLFEKCGLELIDVKNFSAKGGSIRVIAQRIGGAKTVSKNVAEILQEEQEAGIAKPDVYLRFAESIEASKQKVLEICKQYKNEGKRIVGYGASHSTTTLVYHFELAELLDYQVDDNPIKQGEFSPGHHIPVYPSDKLYTDKPDCVLILAWNYSDPIMQKNQSFLDQGGTFIIPLPELQIVKK